MPKKHLWSKAKTSSANGAKNSNAPKHKKSRPVSAGYAAGTSKKK